MTYRIDYTGDASDNGHAVIEGRNAAPEIRYVEMPRRGFGVPSIVKTSAAFLLGGAVLFGLEAQGPVEFRPFTLMGTYDSRVEEQVKAAEMRVQGRYEGWAAQVKASAEQNVEQHKAKTSGFIAAYQGGLDRAKTYAQLTGQLQSQLVAAQLSRTGSEQSLEVAMIESAGANLGESKRAVMQSEDILKVGDGRQIIRVAGTPHLFDCERVPFFMVDPWKFQIRDVRDLHKGTEN